MCVGPPFRAGVITISSLFEPEGSVSATIALLLCLTIQSPAGGDETAVRDVVKKYVDARDRSDESAIRALFTDDADQLTSSGEWRKGRENVVRGTLASSKGNPGSRTIAVETVRFPAPGLAIADGRYEISGGPEGTREDVDVFRDDQIGAGLADRGDSQHVAGSARQRRAEVGDRPERVTSARHARGFGICTMPPIRENEPAGHSCFQPWAPSILSMA